MTTQAATFLLENQQATGSWSDTQFPDSVGVTALCCLALMAEGNLPNRDRMGRTSARELEFLPGEASRKKASAHRPRLKAMGSCMDTPWRCLRTARSEWKHAWRP